MKIDVLIKKLTNLTRNTQDAEDAVQDALLSIHKNSYDVKYLESRSYQKAMSNHKYNKKRTEHHIEIETIEIDSNWNTDNIDNINVLNRIYKALTLSEQKLLTILMSSDCNCHWAAENSNYSLSSFKVLLYNLRNRLRKEDYL